MATGAVTALLLDWGFDWMSTWWLWDLVHNGISYSVQHQSATTNKRALDKLRLRP